VISTGTVGADERIRLFCALRLPEEVLDAIEQWQRSLTGGRLVGRQNLHVTLAFLGHRPLADLEPVRAELRAAAEAATERLVLAPERYRETRSVGMLVLGDENRRALALARDLHHRLERLGVYEPEARRWLPHVTVLRFRERPRLQPELPPLEPFAPSDAAVYLSRLSPHGAQYEVLDSVALGG
jgi:RNA 2',3'-cyclic 3'-phosphodiesterase